MVTFAGSISDINRVLRAFAVGVNSSDSEGFSNAIIEYMMAGIPSVASDTSGNRELIEDDVNGALVPPGDRDALARAIIGYIQDPDRRAREA